MSSGLGDRRKRYDQDDIEKVKKLVQILQMYEEWENGDFQQAKTLADSFSPLGKKPRSPKGFPIGKQRPSPPNPLSQ